MTTAVLKRRVHSRVDQAVCTATRHGDLSAYMNYGCSHAEAIAAHAAYQRLRRTGQPTNRRVPAFRVQRRIRALWRIGHNSEVIAARARVHSANVTAAVVVLTSTRTRYVRPHTAEAIFAAYEDLKGRYGESAQTAALARLHGYVPPEAWPGCSIDDRDAQPVDDPVDDRDAQPVEDPVMPPVEDRDEDPDAEVDEVAAEVDEVAVYEALRGRRPAVSLGKGLERMTYAVAYLYGRGEDGRPHAYTGLTFELHCSGDAVLEYVEWADALRPAARERGLHRGFWVMWSDLAELAELVAAERDRRRLVRIASVHAAHGLVRSGQLYPAVRAALVAAHASGWRRWPYRIPDQVADAAFRSAA